MTRRRTDTKPHKKERGDIRKVERTQERLEGKRKMMMVKSKGRSGGTDVTGTSTASANDTRKLTLKHTYKKAK